MTDSEGHLAPPAPAIDTETLAALEGVTIQGPASVDAPSSEPPSPAAPIPPGLDELVEDTFQLRRQVQALERGQQDMLARLDALAASVSGGARAQAVELDTLRRELLGDSKARSTRGVFNAVVMAMDLLRMLQAGAADPGGGAAVLAGLRNLLQSLGYLEFVIGVGRPFDAAWMECVEYAEGPPGVVLGVVRPGYRSGDTVVRPCGVRIADPATRTRTEEE